MKPQEQERRALRSTAYRLIRETGLGSSTGRPEFDVELGLQSGALGTRAFMVVGRDPIQVGSAYSEWCQTLEALCSEVSRLGRELGLT